MSLIPEIIFQTAIVRGLTRMRTDSKFIDQLFRNLSQSHQEQMRDFIRSNQIDLNLNYPRSELTVPAIVILLKNENESQAFLGDSMGYQTPEEFDYESGIDGEILGGTASTSTLSGLGSILVNPTRVVSSTNNTLKAAAGSFYADQFMSGTERNLVHIVAGVGKGQIRQITANTSDTIMTGTNWVTNPDSSSVFEVREPEQEVVGQPTSLYDTGDVNTFLERKGSLYTNRYQAQVVGANQEQTIYLYAILKAIFTLSRLFMEGQGIINFKMNGTDFTARPEYIPSYAYMRVLNIEFEHPFDVYEPLEPLIKDFTLALCDGITESDLQVSGDLVAIGRTPPSVTG